MRAGAFVAWRNEVVLTGMFGGKVLEGSETFNAYLSQFGLLTADEKRDIAEKQEAARAIRKEETKRKADQYRKMWKAQLTE